MVASMFMLVLSALKGKQVVFLDPFQVVFSVLWTLSLALLWKNDAPNLTPAKEDKEIPFPHQTKVRGPEEPLALCFSLMFDSPLVSH